MSDQRLLLSRRGLFGGLASAGGLLLTGCGEQLPPTYGNILRMGDNLTYTMQRALFSPTGLAREYDRSDISSMPATGTYDPSRADGGLYDPAQGPDYARLHKGDFADWRLQVEGSVARPGSFSLADLQRMHRRTQITRHMCEEGWTAIAEWTGVPVRSVLEAVGIKPSARYVEFHTFDLMANSLDMIDALHPQTILAYGMNGRNLPIGHGAPLRLRVERQIGYKSVKFLRKIVVTDVFRDTGDIKSGWAWYNGI
ncbi:molybdopterin-dependent oxidoreductase [Sandarakinorhabdus oryzae]|uniref:molybdopterin-dependent oxidoreductase n=1 Tax=Sandarakinorhabdus oryzae TaxID=2675220 RepID=UPI0012E1CCA1|nr:molybdopterin-dependent oxidoreductase [Sandarakinorhabdus oryzae]